MWEKGGEGRVSCDKGGGSERGEGRDWCFPMFELSSLSNYNKLLN